MPTLEQESFCPFPTDIEVGHNLQTRDKDCMRGRILECGHGDRVQFHLASGSCKFEIIQLKCASSGTHRTTQHVVYSLLHPKIQAKIRAVSASIIGIPCQDLLQTVVSRDTLQNL